MDQGRLFTRNDVQYVSVSEIPSGRDITFISHQNSDNAAAVKIANSLKDRGYDCYVDTLDPAVDGKNPQLESYLRSIIRKCPRLMAVVSERTQNSWWVPLEIGVALEREKSIATFLLSDPTNLPTYLWLWPILQDLNGTLLWLSETNTKMAQTVHAEWRAKSRAEQLAFSRGGRG